jgi:hypothetical protein
MQVPIITPPPLLVCVPCVVFCAMCSSTLLTPFALSKTGVLVGLLTMLVVAVSRGWSQWGALGEKQLRGVPRISVGHSAAVPGSVVPASYT